MPHTDITFLLLKRATRPTHPAADRRLWCHYVEHTKTVVLTTALAFLACGQQAWINTAGAADFSHSKKTYVPPSIIDRRVDFSSLREHQAVEDTDSVTKAGPPPAFGSPRPVDVPGGTQSQLSATSTHAHYMSESSSHAKKVSHGNATHAISESHSSGPAHHAPHSVAHSSRDSRYPPAPPYPNVDLSQASRAVRQRLHNIATSPTTMAEVASLKRQADELVRDGKVQEAKHTLAKILQLTPSDKQFIRQVGAVSVERAKQFANSQQFDQAEHYARQALSLDGNNADARKILGAMLSRTGENPNDVSERLKNAELLASQGHNDEAAVEYEEADRLKPTAAGHIGLGNMAVRSNQKKRARNEYMQALEVDPNSAGAHRQLGLLKYGAGDIVGANSELSRALIIDPHDATSSRTLIELWQHQVSHVPNANSHLGLARAYQLAGDLQSAQTEYRTVVQMDPENAHLPAARQSFKLAMARQEAEKDVQAAHTLESQGALMDAYAKVIEAERLSPGDSRLRVYQGTLLEHLQNPAAARHAYLDALKLNPHQIEAAARLKALPAEQRTIMTAADGARSALSSPLSPGTPALASAMSSQGMPPVPGATPHDPLVQLSNFAYQLRNHMVVQKKNIESVEDTAHDIVSKIGDPPASETIHGDGGIGETLATATDGSAGSGSAAPDALGSSVDSALASAKAALSAAKGERSPGGAGAHAHAHASTAGRYSSTAAESSSPSSTDDSKLASSNSPTSSPASGNATYKKLAELQRQNDQLKQQLSQMHRQAAKRKAVAANGAQSQDSTPAQPVSPAPVASSAHASGTSAVPKAIAESPTMAPVMPAADFSESQFEQMPPLAPPMNASRQSQAPVDALLNGVGLTSALNPVTPALSLTPPSASLPGTDINPQPLPLRAPLPTPGASNRIDRSAIMMQPPAQGQSLAAPGSSLPSMPYSAGSIPAGAAVKLSLESASVKMTGVELVVDLRNDMGSALKIPEKVHAVIRYSNRKDADVHVSFADTTVPAHGAVKGTIKVPFDKVDPTADLIIPGLLPPGSASRDVHLTTSMALR